jgi:hypothetical protein
MTSGPFDVADRTGFDEYLIGAPSVSSFWGGTRPILVGVSISLFVAGVWCSLPILFVLWSKWPEYSGAFMLADLHKQAAQDIPAGFHAWNLIYNAWALPLGLLTLAMLLFSACLISRQIEHDQSSARLAHMPAVFVRPRLKWSSIGVEGKALVAERPKLFIDLLNVGETPAIRLQLHVVDLYVNTRSSRWWSRRCSKIGIQLDHDNDKNAYYARLVPADHDSKGEGGITENLVRTHIFSVSAPPEARLLPHLLSGGDFPALVLLLNVEFETIRNTKFNETIAVRWSGLTCRSAATPQQRDQMRELSETVRDNEQHGWNAYQPPYTANGKPKDLSLWTSLTVSPKVANERVGRSLMWGGGVEGF